MTRRCNLTSSFNIAVDAVLQEWHVQVTTAHLLTGLSAFFCADNG
jgi:hypothetical protein